MKRPSLSRYGGGAKFYDVVSFERPVYRPARVRAVELLHLEPGDTVLDIGCGTGLNHPLLVERIGPSGHIVGIDASESMLAQARRRTPSTAVELVRADAGDLRTALGGRRFDAVIATYTMSIIGDWRAAWEQALEMVVPGARVAIVDLAMPTGVGRLLAPAARFACFTGGVDLTRRPWTLVTDLDDVTLETRRAGHTVLAVGSAL